MLSYICRLPIIVRVFSLFFLAGLPQGAEGLVWKMPPDQFAPASTGTDYDLAADPSGNAYTAFIESGTDVKVARFSSITGTYGAPVTLYSGSTANQVAVATDASGTALVVWFDDTLFQVMSAFYNGTTWVTPTPSPIDTLANAFSNVQVTMDGLGNGLAAWNDFGLTPPGDVIVSFFDGGTQTWSSPQTLNAVGVGATEPQIAYSSNGTAVALWSDAAENVYASNFNGTTWTVAPPVIATTAINYDVGIDSAGNAVAIWVDSGTFQVMSSFYNGATWGAPQTISTTPASTEFFANFDMAPTGTAIVTWVNGTTAYYSEFIGGVWTPEAVLMTDVASTPAVALDSSGNALVVFNAETDPEPAYSLYKPFGGVFGPPDLIAPDSTTLTVSLAALSDNGRGFTTGLAPPGEGAGVAGTYTLIALPPPVISGSACSNKFASQTDRVHIITWGPSIDPTVTGYLLYRNGVLIAVIPATGPFIYEDHNRGRCLDVYSLIIVTPLGQSAPAVVILQ